MSVSNIDVSLFKKMVINGAINLKNHRDEVDRLNVFPVPDGDTGTNMAMTITSGVTELENCESSGLAENAKMLSRGTLMGARGNSGVILSQFFRGFSVGLKALNTNELSLDDFKKCLLSGKEIAYKAVTQPVEGTILTVIRCAIENTIDKQYSDIVEFFTDYLAEAKKALQNTPNLLPVLKEAGVEDSGGTGFYCVAEGMLKALNGEILVYEDETSEASSTKEENVFNYEMQFEVSLKKPENFEERELAAALSLLGDNLSLDKNNGKVSVKLHTDRPGRALEIAQKSGEFTSVAIKNLTFKEEDKKSLPKKNFAVISVCFGDGISKTFKDLGVDYIIEGGQTMNPSTEAFVNAINECNAKNVIIIPNNGNVIMAAKQAVNLVEGVNVSVLEAKTISQGYAALVGYNSEASMEENMELMMEQVKGVTTGELTYSIRDTEIGGLKISSGDYMGIVNNEIVVATKEKKDALKSLLEKVITDESEVITIFCGSDVSKDSYKELEKLCLKINSDLDVEIIEGNQDIYSYIIAVE